VPELVPQELEDSDDEVEDDDEEESVPTIRCSTRIAGGDRKLEKYTLATKYINIRMVMNITGQ
jgi:hypothetical protein